MQYRTMAGSASWIAPMMERSAAGVAGPGVKPPAGHGATSIGAGAVAHAPHDFSLEAQFSEWGRRPQGSNQWAIAPSRTADGSEISEDDEKRQATEVQKATDQFIGEVDGVLASKEKEIMQV